MSMRSFLKQVLPPPAKKVIQGARKLITPPPIDDIVLADFQVVKDDCADPRLTLVLPRLAAGSDFGGFATGIDIYSRLILEMRKAEPLDLRVLITDVIAETDPTIVTSRAAKAGLTIGPDQIELVRHNDASISVRANEVFMTYNWWTTLNFAKVREAQAEMFGKPLLPMVWLMQDYEPAFMQFSSAHMLAREAYDSTEHLWGVINSSNLAEYIETVGHNPERTFVFEPVVSDALRPYLDKVSSSTRKKRILVYGRPIVERNCFPALVRGLQQWVQDYSEFADWEVVSAGVPHDPVDLGDGRKLTSVGKLPLEEYAEMLLESSVGVSLMASPHPSYPPLEMSHFGLRTITNGYVCKDLSDFHPNITALRSISAPALSSAIAEACKAADSPPSDHRNPVFVREENYPFLGDLSSSLRAAIDRS